MTDNTELELLLEKHIEQKSDEKTNRLNDDNKLKIKYILDEILKAYNSAKASHEAFHKDNYSIMTAVNEGKRLALLHLIDDINSWFLDEDEKIIIDELKED